MGAGSVKWLTGGFTKDLAAKQHDIDDQIRLLQGLTMNTLSQDASHDSPTDKVHGVATDAPVHTLPPAVKAPAGKTGKRPATGTCPAMRMQPASCNSLHLVALCRTGRRAESG